MDLLIENGILLKPYDLAWTPNGWAAAPAGWTPDRDARVLAQADEIQRAEPATPREFALLAAEKKRGRELYRKRHPWHGWVPVTARADRKISRAYRQYFMDMNPDVINEGNVMSGAARARAAWPPDGRYIFRNGKIQRAALLEEFVLTEMETNPND
jgi:hypothetical protein